MKWFCAGRWIAPPLSDGYWHAWTSTDVYARLKLPRITGSMMVLDGYFLYPQNELDELVNFSLNKIECDPRWFEEFFKECVHACNALEKASASVNHNDLASGWKSFERPMRNLFTLWSLAYLHFDHALNKAFHDFSVQSKIPEEELAALVKPSRPSRVVAQQREARQLKKKILEAIGEAELKDSKKVLATLKKNAPVLYDEIQKHLKKFGYIGIHHFWGEPLSFEKILDIDFKENPQHESKVPSEAKQLVYLGSEIAFWRLYLAETSGVAAFNLLQFFKQSASALGVKKEDYMYLADFEYETLLEDGQKVLLETIELRRKKSGIISDGISARVVAGEELAKKLSEVLAPEKTFSDHLTGVVACKGKAIGHAKIVLMPQDLLKIEAGDILVAPETAPDFVSAMRKCAAVVTDQGGITSHAAIVSRELSIPCIVGTKNATKVLKDGEKIEVDAVKGIVKKLGGVRG